MMGEEEQDSGEEPAASEPVVSVRDFLEKSPPGRVVVLEKASGATRESIVWGMLSIPPLPAETMPQRRFRYIMRGSNSGAGQAMATELTDEDRALLEQCIRKALGPKINPADFIYSLPDPAKTVQMIKADEEAAYEYMRRRQRIAS
jgi:hypothetical protein